MNLDDMDKLKFDRRLEHRRGWLEPGEREAHLENLQDATDKIHDGSEEPVPEAAAPASVSTPPAPAISTPPAPVMPTPTPAAEAPATAPLGSGPEGGLGGPTT